MNEYMEKMQKLIPSEILAGYIAIKSLVCGTVTEEETISTILLVALAVLILLTPLYLVKFYGVNNASFCIASCISLALFAIAMGSVIDSQDWYRGVYGSVAVILWTLLAPMIIGDAKK